MKKRILSLFLVFCMVFGIFPTSAFAEEIDSTQISTIIIAEEGASEEGVPEEGTPEEGTPEEGTPEGSVPEESTPEESVPEESTPEESAPEASTPEEGMPTEIPTEEQEKEPAAMMFEAIPITAIENPTLNISDGDIIFTEDGSDNKVQIGSNASQVYTGTVTITGDELTGEPTTNKIIVESGTHDICLYFVNIDTSSKDYAAFEVKDNAEAHISLVHNNILTSAPGKAGLQVNHSATVIIVGDAGLHATGGEGANGIGGSTSEAGGKINIIGGTVVATGGENGAGIGGTITIGGGRVIAKGGKGAAGIGGSASGSGSTITINSGIVTATGGSLGAGIGGGNNGSGGTITINGGTVIATGGYNGTGIGGGQNGTGGTITIDGTANVTAICGNNGAGIGGGYNGLGGNITIDGAATVIAVSSGDSTPAIHDADNTISGAANVLIVKYEKNNSANIATTIKDASGADLSPSISYTPTRYYQSIAFTVPSEGDYTVFKDETQQAYGSNVAKFTVSAGLTSFEGVKDCVLPPAADVAVNINDGNIILSVSGDNKQYKIGDETPTTYTGEFIIKHTGGVATQNTVIVESGTHDITLKGVNIDVSALPDTCAFEVADTATANITLADGTTNTLRSGSTKAGLQVPVQATVNISGIGTLNATGRQQGAGIGGEMRGAGGTINIISGTITATGGQYAAGIGGGGSGIGGTININGGTITATGGDSGAGIGGGENSAGKTININGGTVSATGGQYAAGIGGGENGAGKNININGGTVTAIGGASQGVVVGGAGIGGGGGRNSITGGQIIIGDAATVIAVSDNNTRKAIDDAYNDIGTDANVIMVNYAAKVDGTATKVSDSNGQDEVTSYTPTVTYQSIAFTLTDSVAYTVFKGDEKQAHVNNNPQFTANAGLNSFNVIPYEVPAEEQFNLTTGQTYYFDLSSEVNNIGTINAGIDTPKVYDGLPDTSLHYVPFTYVGTVYAYSLHSRSTNDEIEITDSVTASNNTTDPNHPIGYKSDRNLFVANYNVSHTTISWNDLNAANLIFGKTFDTNYKLRTLSAGSAGVSGVTPATNEWDSILRKSDSKDNYTGYIKNWKNNFSWGQDTPASEFQKASRAVRGNAAATNWNSYDATRTGWCFGWRPALEVLKPDELGKDGLKAVTLDLNGGQFNKSTNIKIVCAGDNFTAPSATELIRPTGNTDNYFKWNTEQDGSGTDYDVGASVPNNVTTLYAIWETPPTYTVTVKAGTARPNPVKAGETVTVTADPAAKGKIFASWTSTDVTFADANSSKTTFIMPAMNVTVVADYMKIPERIISGTVTEKDGGSAVSDATVKVVKKSLTDDVIATTTTNADGRFSFTDIPYGVYSLVVTHGEGENLRTNTSIVKINQANTTKDIQLLSGKKDTVVMVENVGIPPTIAVNNLEDMFDGNEKNTDVVEIKLIVSDKTTHKPDAEKVTSKLLGVEKVGIYLDAKLMKTVNNGRGEAIQPPSGKKLKIVIDVPADLQNKSPYSIIRVHDNIAEKFEGKYDNIYHTLTFEADKFSTYAIAYTDPTVATHQLTINNGGTGASGSGNYVKDDVVNINAGTKSGYTFSHWTSSNGGIFGDKKNSQTTFTMPANDITITANWTKNNGGSSGGGSSYDYYDIKISKEGNGTISPDSGSDNILRVREWSDKTFAFTPDKGYVVSGVLVDGKSLGVKSSYTFENVRRDHILKVIFKVSGHKNPQTGVFVDVKEDDWFYEYVINTVEKSWFAGTSDTTFSPYLSTTRGMIATVLHRMEQSPIVLESSVFEDVLADSWYFNSVTWAQENEVVRGYGNGQYGPNDNITREQMAAILYRYASFKGYDVSKRANLDNFTDDKQISSYAIEAIQWAVANGLLSGKGDNVLDPKGNATRAEVATILTRFDNLFKKQ